MHEERPPLNIELQAKIADLSRLTNDMNNLPTGTAIATIFMDGDLRVGRPIYHIASRMVGYDSLAEDLRL